MFFANLFGALVFVGSVAWVLHAHSAMWRKLAASYAGASHRPVLATKAFEQVTIAGRGLAFRNYVPLTVSVHEDGISLAVWRPLSLRCPPLFLPFSEMSCRRTDWFLSRNVFAIRLARADVDVVVAPRLWNWLEANSSLMLG